MKRRHRKKLYLCQFILQMAALAGTVLIKTRRLEIIPDLPHRCTAHGLGSFSTAFPCGSSMADVVPEAISLDQTVKYLGSSS